MKAVSLILLGLFAAGCNLPFDTAPNTPAQARKKAKEAEVADARPAPSSPFVGYRFYFGGALPEDWYVSSRGEDQPLAPGYTALCVVSNRKGVDKMLILLASSADAAARKEAAEHASDVDWLQPRIPLSFFDASRAAEDAALHVTRGDFAKVDSLMVFAVLSCKSATCESSLANSRDFIAKLQIRTARADDEHVVSPSGNDCGSRF